MPPERRARSPFGGSAHGPSYRNAMDRESLTVQERAEALLLRVYGRPIEKLEVTHPQTVEDVEQMSLAEIRQLRTVVESDSSS
jgi:hypothetical protein